MKFTKFMCIRNKKFRINRTKLDFDSYLHRILVIEEKTYTNVGFKLSDIAVHLNCSTVKLPRLLNFYANQNYKDFINRYRLAKFKQCVKSPAYSRCTLLVLAEMCGFKKSSFFLAFKKIGGITPAEHIKKKR